MKCSPTSAPKAPAGLNSGGFTITAWAEKKKGANLRLGGPQGLACLTGREITVQEALGLQPRYASKAHCEIGSNHAVRS
ncbi:hypothetical protein NDU88_005706 [Pleurodeles waltl]|uniref:FHA domain-containing protein n=1 Tax=Pleurodeles waltl TaxID=8319 RepID=A0AAV7RLU2_PLEWA|nr:hypothetical protein NDU88_005706 [Pleurodeles waltl]